MCGAKATTSEHKFKHSHLRQIARRDGEADPRNVHKFSATLNDTLRSLNKGSQVRWGKNLCAPCNNTRSQPFDRAYDRFVAFMLAHADNLHSRTHLDWAEVYGEEWQEGAISLARYFVKQFGCMMATERLHVPQDAIDFVQGSPRSASLHLALWRDHRIVQAHKMLQRRALENGLMDFVGLPETHAVSNQGRLVGASYQCRLAYMIFNVDWREGTDEMSFHEQQVIPLPKINARLRDRIEWFPVQARGVVHRMLNAPEAS